ncbi:MAG: ankyrin repeat domain-containing protein [Candidatus Hydrogenedentes bacterium]|nr:ankyrin repeat domain-containing protein [Candidatus Hydrogenedentota bacterium]
MDFMQAVADGNVEQVKKALAGMRPAEVNKPGHNKSTALMAAASLGNLDITRMLIDAGAALDVQDADEQTALMYAVCRQNEQVVTLLLEAGARGDIENWRAFDFAIRFGTPAIVKQLIDRGADVNRRDADNDPTPFLEAVARGNREVIEMLIEAGADIYASAGDQTAVSIAAGNRNEEIFDLVLNAGCPLGPALNNAVFTQNEAIVKKLLKHGVNVNERNEQFGYTPLLTAAEGGNVAIVKMLIKAGSNLESRDEMGQTPLWAAVSSGHTAIAKVLLDAGADINVQSDEGQSLLANAAWMEEKGVLDLLLKRGADPNAASEQSPAALLWAVAQGSLAIAKQLLKAGANPNAAIQTTRRTGLFEQYAPGTTALMIAASEGNGKLVDALLEAGADPKATNSKNESATDFAAERGRAKILERLEQAGATVDRSSKHMQDAILLHAAEQGDVANVKSALAAGARVDVLHKESRVTPLMCASLEGHTEIAQLLLAAGANPNLRSEWGQTPLRNAVVRGHTDLVRVLLESGADPNIEYDPASIPTEKENTVYPSMDSPLADAAQLGRAEILELLIQSGAGVNKVSASGNTALLAAVLERQFDLAKRLLEADATRREEDADFLAVLDWAESAEAAAYRESVQEVAAACAAQPEPVDWLPGCVAFQLTAEEADTIMKEAVDAASAAIARSRKFNEDYDSLAKRVDGVVRELAGRMAGRGYHLIDAGMPIGCGHMTRYLMLIPSNDKYAIMAAFGVRGNDMELTTRDILTWFREMDASEPFRLVGCKFDTVSIELDRPVSNPEVWAVKLSEFCPDSFHSDDDSGLVEQLRTTTRLTFWWD